MDATGADNERELQSLFDEALPAIHRTLVLSYRFIPEEAEAFENTLRVWFGRMSRRLSGRRAVASDLREQLLFVTCKYARAFQIAKFRGIEPSHEEFTMTLARPPEEVALELLRRMETEARHV